MSDEKPTRERKAPTEFQLRARKENLKKANAVNAERKRKKDMVKLDERLSDISDEIDDSVEKQVKKHLGKIDRNKLKNEVLQVFHDMGGRKEMRKWAKDNPGKYYTLMSNILKAESDKGDGGGGGVTVNLFGLGPDNAEIDITPAKS